MAGYRELPIRRKLVVIGIATITAALLLNNLFFVVSTFVFTRGSVYADAVAQATIMAENTAASLAFEDQAAAVETLTAMHAKPSVDQACLYRHSGELFAEYAETSSGVSCPATPGPDGDLVDTRGVVVVRPVLVRGTRIGSLYLHATLEELWTRIRVQGIVALGGLALSTLVAFGLAVRLHRTIADPLDSLAQAAADVSERNDYTVRAVKATHDEIGAVVDAFNNMLDRVQRRDADLSAANANLSREVLERQRVEAERSELLKREREANRLKDEFLAALSHELRTPLNAILGWIQILRSTGSNDEKAGRGLASIERNARAQARMIEDLLDISRIISGKFHLKMDVVEVGAAVDAGLDAVRPTAAARDITLNRDLPDQPCYVSGDQDRLQQVMWNLLSNAVKFTPTGGAIHVHVTCDQAVCCIAVRDTGIGIGPEFLPHVFDRFRQADGSMAREHGGLGLGLAIVHEVVELHGGSVTAESNGRDLGSVFTIRLPRILQNVGVAAAGHGHAGSSVLQNLSILVVDDDADAREIAATALTAAGASVTTADSAAAAWSILERRDFAALVCDIGMPEVDGYMFLRRVREHAAARVRGTRAIAMTAYAAQEDIARAHAAGYNAHVAKPFSIVTLVNAVASVTRSGSDVQRA